MQTTIATEGAAFQASLRDARLLPLYPALKRRAIFNCPYGTRSSCNEVPATEVAGYVGVPNGAIP